MSVRWWDCFFGHKWTAWNQVIRNLSRMEGGSRFDYIEHWLVRDCVKCGLREAKEIYL